CALPIFLVAGDGDLLVLRLPLLVLLAVALRLGDAGRVVALATPRDAVVLAVRLEVPVLRLLPVQLGDPEEEVRLLLRILGERRHRLQGLEDVLPLILQLQLDREAEGVVAERGLPLRGPPGLGRFLAAG